MTSLVLLYRGRSMRIRAETATVMVMTTVCACSRPTQSEPSKRLSFEHQTGVVLARPERTCLYISAHSLPAGTRVSVLPLGGALVLAEAEVVRAMERCTETDEPGTEGNWKYELKPLMGEIPKLTPAVGLVGFTGSIKTLDGAVTADLDGDGKVETFRYCASSEGLHFTLWNGRPLEGVRRWHRYLYLGMDTEANCTPLETEP